jgi:hypothetical protein
MNVIHTSRFQTTIPTTSRIHKRTGNEGTESRGNLGIAKQLS